METNIDFCKMKVVIVAGGKGTRIASVAADIPKSMIPIAGKPVVEYQIELAKRYGFTDILFIVGHLGEQIETYFGDGSRWGVTISYFHEQEPLGTSGALPLLVNQLTNEFWVFYGDTMMDFDMEAMLQAHQQRGAKATLFLHPNDHPYDSDLVEIDEQGMVKAFISKPHDPAQDYRNLVNAALYILNKDCVSYIPEGKSDFGKHIFPSLLTHQLPLAGYVSSEYIKDMGTPDRWAKVEKDVLSGKVARLNRKYPRPAVFLDRDGVICKEVNLLSQKQQVELLLGAAEAIKQINTAGYLAIIVTNQPVIARNLCSLEDLADIHKRLETRLGEEHAFVDAIYFCPHHPDKGYPEERVEYKIECTCRKPKPGMLLQAASDWNIDLQQSYMIGDRQWDVMAGEAAGVKKSVLIETNKADALLHAINELL